MIQSLRRIAILTTLSLVASCKDEVTFTDAAVGPDSAALDGNSDVDAGLDPTAPVTTIDTGPDDPTREALAVLAFSASEPATFECRLDGGAPAACTSPFEATVADGPHGFEVRATDIAGNVEATWARHGWRTDTAAPDTTITSAPPAIDNSVSVAFAFTADEAATFECRLDGAAFAPCASPHPIAGLTDGAHVFAVRAIDLAGNLDATPASHAWTIDSSTPDTVIDSGPAAAVSLTDARFTFSSADAGPGATFECRLDAAGFAPCASPRNLAGLAAGDHTFRVRVIDAVGNPDPTPASWAWTIDLTAPDTTIDSGPSGAVDAPAASFTFSTAGAADTFECRLDTGSFAPCTSPRGYTGLADGEHRFEVRARDLAGNLDATPAIRTWTVDTVAPDTTITSGPADPSNQVTPSFSFAASEAGATFACRSDAGSFAPCSSPHPVAGLADGSHTFEVRARDAVGHLDPTPASQTWIRDTAGPTVLSVTSSTPDGRYTAGAAVLIQVSFSEIVGVTGAPTLLLETGATDRAATLDGGAGTTALTFRYTVVAGDRSPDLDYQSTGALAGGTLRDDAGNDAIRSLASPGAAGSLGAARALVIAASVPVMTGVTLSPAGALTTTTLTCAPTATDADGDPVSYQYEWLRDSVVIGGATGSSLDGGHFAEGQSMRCRVTPSDGALTGAPMTSGAIVIANTPPVVTGVTLTPAAAFTSSTLTCSPTGYDLDAESFSYQYAWLRNNGPIAGAAASTLDGSFFVEGDALQCVVAPFDGSATGGSLGSNTLVIANSPPSGLSGVSLTPVEPTTTDTLTCAPSGGADPDEGDAPFYVYRWGRNGELVVGQSGATLTPDHFGPGDVIACEAAAHDGTVEGPASLSNSVSVSLGPTCSPGLQLGCGGSQQGSNASGSAQVSSYACASWNESGPEVAYAFTATSSGPATVSLSGMQGGDLDLFVLADTGTGCAPGNCVTHGDSSASFVASAGTTYYLVVDGYNGAVGSYTISLACQ